MLTVDRTHPNAPARWAGAATSSKTGGYRYFRPRRKCKSIPVSLFIGSTAPQRGARVLVTARDRTHLNAPARWAGAATSSKTGGYRYFRPRRKCKSIPVSLFIGPTAPLWGARVLVTARDRTHPNAPARRAGAQSVKKVLFFINVSIKFVGAIMDRPLKTARKVSISPAF